MISEILNDIKHNQWIYLFSVQRLLIHEKMILCCCNNLYHNKIPQFQVAAIKWMIKKTKNKKTKTSIIRCVLMEAKTVVKEKPTLKLCLSSGIFYFRSDAVLIAMNRKGLPISSIAIPTETIVLLFFFSPYHLLKVSYF